jgi:hypothetical protein
MDSNIGDFMADEVVEAKPEVVKQIMKSDAITAEEQTIIDTKAKEGKESRRVLCNCGCGKVQGMLSFPKGTSEAQWATAMTGYYNSECEMPKVELPPDVYEMAATIKALQEQIAALQKA